MKIIQIGVERSGNLWLWKIIESILRQSGLESKRYIHKQPIYQLEKEWRVGFDGKWDVDILDIQNKSCYYHTPFFFKPIEDIDEYVASTSHVWCHSLFDVGSELVLRKFDKIIYIIRDPRDSLISLAHYVFTPPRMALYIAKEDNPQQFIENRYISLIKHWAAHVGGYLLRRHSLNIHFIFYERLLDSFETELHKLTQYLGVNLDQNQAASIQKEMSFSMMKLKDPHHLRKGEAGNWQVALTHKQKKTILEIAGPLLEYLNYQSIDFAPGKMSNRNSLPDLPEQINQKQLLKIISKTQRPTWQEIILRTRHMVKDIIIKLGLLSG